MPKPLGVGASPDDVESIGIHLNGRVVALSAVTSVFNAMAAPVPQLQGVPGCFVPSTLNAVLGTADSGKTDLLKLLGGVSDSSSASGSIIVAGLDPLTATQQHVSAFVHDFDALISNLTVEAQLQYAADFTYARNSLSPTQKRECIDDVVGLLDLEGVRRSNIGDAWRPGISDVEKKLVSIGMAMLGVPDVLLVDGPTYKLGHADGNRVMRTLKAIAQRGTTVIVALDAPTPTAYALLDSVLVLQQGRTVYYGRTGEPLMDHFEAHCPQVTAPSTLQLPESEWLLDILEQSQPSSNADQRSSNLADAFETAPAYKAAEKEAAGYTEPTLKTTSSRSGSLTGSSMAGKTGTPAWLTLPLLLKHRTLRNVVDPAWVLIRAADKLFFSLLIMSVYWHRGSFLDPGSFGNIISILWMFSILPLFSATQYLAFVALEMPMYLRERRRGWYGATAYMAHKMIEELGLTIIMTLPFDAILFYPMQLHGQFVFFWLVHLVSSSIGILVVYLAATLTPSIELAAGLVPAVLIAILFFGGALIRTLDIPRWWQWFSYLVPLRYSFGGLMMNEYTRLGFEPLLMTYDLLGRNKWHYLGYEAVFVAGLLVMLWVALTCKRRASQYHTSIRPRCS